MPYQVNWYQDKRIIFNKLYGACDFESAVEASTQVSQLLAEGNAPIHLIVDMSDLQSFPTNVTRLNGMTSYLKNPSLGWVVVIGGNSLSKFVVNVISQIIKFRATQRFTLNDAVQFLESNDVTLAAQVVIEP
jgi:hypothetical protein